MFENIRLNDGGARLGIMIGGALLLLLAIAFIKGLSVLLSATVLLLCLFIYYSGLNLLTKDTIVSIFISILILIGLSFIESPFNLYLLILVNIGLLLLIYIRKEEYLEMVRNDFSTLRGMNIIEYLTWIAVLFIVVFLGLQNADGIFAHDYLHPMYEASLGNSYNEDLFNTPDLSYAGRTLKYHFITTRIPGFFSEISGLSIFESVFFLTPLFNVAVLFLILKSFFTEFKEFRTPTWFLFSMPLIFINLRVFSGILGKTVLLTNSYFLAFIFSIFIIYFFLKDRRLLLYIGLVILIIVRAPVFITLVGGILLYYFSIKSFAEMLKFAGISAVIFVTMYMSFLAGSHQQNLWIIFPSNLYFSVIVPLLSGGISPRTMVIWGAPLVLSFGMFAFFILRFFRSVKDRDSDVQHLFLSVSMSGILGILLLTEVTESNSFQFLIAGFFAMAIILWEPIKNLLKSRIRFRSAYLACFSFSLIFVFYLQTRPILRNVQKWLKSSMTSEMTESSADSVKASQATYTSDIVDAYTWLKDAEKGTVFFGKHYEVNPNDDRKQWWPSTGFIRSALSAQQMYNENYKYKGIIMETDFPERFANSIHFYRNFTIPTKLSRKWLDYFANPDFGKSPGVPLSESNKLHRFLNTMSFGKEWCWLNMQQEVDYQIRLELEKINKQGSTDWLIFFIKSTGIRYIVLENGDTANEELEGLTSTVYSNKTVTILMVTG